MGTLNTEEKTYTTDSGIVIPLVPVPYLLIAAMQTDMTDHPRPPVVEVTLGTQKRVVENADDPTFLERVKEWDNARNMAMIRFVLAVGTNLPPEFDWVERYAAFVPNPTADNMRVYWLLSKLGNDEANDLFEHIMAMTAPTEKGIATAANTFQSPS